mmetsp:Transcript_39775/g.44534  ORF Transcript_39775/g.44534 Transcript_39775/m.44534 type:complete len:151 (-) Transcript_39775:385-837(-)
MMQFQFQFQLFSLFSLLSMASALMISHRQRVLAPSLSPVILYASSSSSSQEEEEEEDPSCQSPCWQDIYDADCTMDSFSARFVASDWIKELPCVQGLGEECPAVPFPAETQLPDIRRGAQLSQSSPVDITNVMEFLNIRRVGTGVDVEKK